ncbi:MAG TPA: histidine triad nucleotide-binding protein [Actinobacteria bacterium]|nr:histidine triad nucleotide-binding protein [Actinomycetes bacterium]HEX21690.1 histidine triad nucleotide-binding protein [Actinomycetota bacterium]
MACIFCQIAGGDVPSEIIYKDEEMVAFNDINPEAPVHILIVPKKHISSLNEAESNDAQLIGRLFLRAAKIAHDKRVDKGYRLVINVGREAGQTVDHLHIHLLGGRYLAWPPG